MSPRPLSVAVIGYGSSAKTFHIPLILATPSLRLYSIVQRSSSSTNDAEADHPGVKVYRSSGEMVRDEGVDVVVITTPPGTHAALVREAVLAGKHGMWVYGVPGEVGEMVGERLVCGGGGGSK